MEDLHSDDIVIRIASNVEPSAGINKRWIPTLQHIACICQSLSQGIQCITWQTTTNQPQFPW